MIISVHVTQTLVWFLGLKCEGNSFGLGRGGGVEMMWPDIDSRVM